MTDTPSLVKPSSKWPYVIAAALIFATASAFVLAILYLRPQSDPGDVILAAGGFAALLYGLVANFMKSVETHATVNSASSEKIALAEAASYTKGELAGACKEQERIAEQALLKAATHPVQSPVANGVVIVEEKKVEETLVKRKRK